MEQLREFFPAVPEQQLRTALSLTGNNVSAAAQYLLNDSNSNQDDEEGTVRTSLTYDSLGVQLETRSEVNSGLEPNDIQVNAGNSVERNVFEQASPLPLLINNLTSTTNNSENPSVESEGTQESPIFTIGTRIRYHDHSDSEWEESDSEDFSVTNYLESYNNRSMFATPSQRRAKVYIQPTNHDQETASSKNKLFWTLFDNKVMLKSHIELLNIQLSATSHKRVAIISQDASMINEVEAQLIFSRYFHGNWDDKKDSNYIKVQNERNALFLPDCISKGIKNDDVIAKKSIGEAKQWWGTKKWTKKNEHGFWAQYFGVKNLNAMWRSLVAQTFFWGDRLFSTVSAITIAPQNTSIFSSNSSTFDAIMQSTERGIRHAAEKNCVVIMPCKAGLSEVYRHGVSILSLLPDCATEPLHFQQFPVQKDNVEIARKRKRSSKNRSSFKVLEDYILKEEDHIHKSEFKIVKGRIQNAMTIFSPGKTPSKFNDSNGNGVPKSKRRRIQIRDENSGSDNCVGVVKNGVVDEEDIKCEHRFYRLSGVVWKRHF